MIRISNDSTTSPYSQEINEENDPLEYRDVDQLATNIMLGYLSQEQLGCEEEDEQIEMQKANKGTSSSISQEKGGISPSNHRDITSLYIQGTNNLENIKVECALFKNYNNSLLDPNIKNIISIYKILFFLVTYCYRLQSFKDDSDIQIYKDSCNKFLELHKIIIRKLQIQNDRVMESVQAHINSILSKQLRINRASTEVEKQKMNYICKVLQILQLTFFKGKPSNIQQKLTSEQDVNQNNQIPKIPARQIYEVLLYQQNIDQSQINELKDIYQKLKAQYIDELLRLDEMNGKNIQVFDQSNKQIY